MRSNELRLLLLLVVGLAPGATKAATPASRSILRPTPTNDDAFAETWTFVADLVDGSYVQIQLSVTNLGPGSGNAMCRLLVARKGAAPWAAIQRFDSSEWSHQPGPPESLKIGPCVATAGAAGLVVHAALEGGSVELRYPALAPPRVLPGTPIVLEGRRYEAWLWSAFQEAKAEVRLPGGEARSVAGGAYADHSRSTIPGRALASTWIRFRALRGAHVLGLGRHTADGAAGGVWLWSGGSEPQAWRDFRVTRGGAAATPTWRVELIGEGSAELLGGPLQYRYAPVESLGLLATVVRPIVGNPVTYTHRATLRRPGQPDVPGVLEVSLDEE